MRLPLFVSSAYWRAYLLKRTHERYTKLSGQARDIFTTARLIMELLDTLPNTLFDKTPTMVLMSHHMELPARTVVHACDQLASAFSIAHDASLGQLKEKSYISLVPETSRATLEQFFRDRNDAYVSVGESFQQLHERLTLLVATILGDEITETSLSAYQQRALYPLLDCYRTWLLTLHRLRAVLDPGSL